MLHYAQKVGISPGTTTMSLAGRPVNRSQDPGRLIRIQEGGYILGKAPGPSDFEVATMFNYLPVRKGWISGKPALYGGGLGLPEFIGVAAFRDRVQAALRALGLLVGEDPDGTKTYAALRQWCLMGTRYSGDGSICGSIMGGGGSLLIEPAALEELEEEARAALRSGKAGSADRAGTGTSTTKKVAIGAGVVAALGLGLYLWRR